MKSINSQKIWGMIGIFMILLVINIPLYSASVMAASLQITKNVGQAGVEGFLDGESDVWAVDVAVFDLVEGEELKSEDVKIVLGTKEKEFDSCSTENGSTVATCKYIESLTDGIPSGAYTVKVQYSGGGEDSALINVDGDAPTITFEGEIKQVEGNLLIPFVVTDQNPCIGLEKIEVIEIESNTVIKTIDDFEEGICEYNALNDVGFAGIVEGLEGEGVMRFKVQAVDKLGHVGTSNIITLNADFVKPKILSVNFTQFGKFIGLDVARTNLVAEISESHILEEVYAAAVGTTLDGVEGNCEETEEEGLWLCEWLDVKVEPSEAIPVEFSATDNFGNKVITSVTQSFIKDQSPPVIEYFGPVRQYDGVGYVADGENKIMLRVSEQGAGIDISGITANLAAIGGGAFDGPDHCDTTASGLECYWMRTSSFSYDTVRINLVKLEDKVGNSPDLPQLELNVDDTPPTIVSMEIYGLSDIGPKDYFQSHDGLYVKVEIDETAGVMFNVESTDIVNDAETLYPSGEFSEDGWSFFTEDTCERNEKENWECAFVTGPIKSGIGAKERFKLKLTDTAGNEVDQWSETKNARLKSATSGEYEITLLGLDDDLNPDYWEDGGSRLLLEFVDVDAMYFPTRLPVQLDLTTDTTGVNALSIEIIGCVPAEEFESSVPELATKEAGYSMPEVSRAVLYGGSFDVGEKNPQPTLVMEFAPFQDTKKMMSELEDGIAPYTCQLGIFSQVGDQATKNVEIQEVQVDVQFGFSELGALDENLAQKIRDVRESGFMQFADAMSYVYEVIEWVNYVVNLLQIIVSIVEIVDLFSTAEMVAADSAEAAAPVTLGTGEALAQALRGGCLAQQQGGRSTWKIVDYLQIPAQILSCNPANNYGFGFGEDDDDEKKQQTGSKEAKPAAKPAAKTTSKPATKTTTGVASGSSSTTKAIAGKASDSGGSSFGWYGKWQRTVLDVYNVASGRDLLGVPAQSLYENLYVSAIGLCVPGIIYNIQKAREIHCRKIVCLGNEVPSGIATVAACNQLYDLLMCEFYVGPLLDMTPFGGISQIGKLLKNMFTSPVGLINVLDVIACGVLCFTPEGEAALTACKLTTGLKKVLGIIDTIIGAIDNRPDITAEPYCDMANSIDLEALAGG